MSKLTCIQIDDAFGRAVIGESVRKIAHSMGVTEGALRFHFRKHPSPKEVRRLAYALFHAEQCRARLDDAEQQAVDRMLARAMKPGARTATQPARAGTKPKARPTAAPKMAGTKTTA